MTTVARSAPETTVLHVGGLHYASEKVVVEQVLGRRPGVLSVDANPVAQTATVVYDPKITSVEALREWVRIVAITALGSRRRVISAIRWCRPTMARTITRPRSARTRRTAMGTAVTPGMSMAAMVADMRNRFAVSLMFTVPIVLWSGVGRG